MSTITATAPRAPMTLLGTGIRALFVGSATGAAGAATPGDHAIVVTVITALSMIAVAVIGPVVAAKVRNRGRGSTDDLVQLLMEQLRAAQKENAERRRENARLRHTISSFRASDHDEKPGQ